MKYKQIKVSTKVYFIFIFMFGSLFMATSLLSYSRDTISQDRAFLLTILAVLIAIVFILSKIKLCYNQEYIVYNTIIKTEKIEINNIEKFYIKSDVKPFRPTFGLYINTVDGKNIVIPINLFKKKELNEFISFLKDKK